MGPIGARVMRENDKNFVNLQLLKNRGEEERDEDGEREEKRVWE